MSYCVNCGVELTASEEACPLCQTPVVNPRAPWQEPRHRPYPPYLETVVRHVDRRYFCLVVALILLIPVSVCLLIDLLSLDGVSWSLYVLGAAMLVMVVVLLPIGWGKRKAGFYLSMDFLMLAVYLWLIDLLSGGGPAWFWPLALPILLVIFLLAGILVRYFSRRQQPEILITLALLSFSAGLLTLAIEIFLNLYRQQPLWPQWAWYSLFPCFLTAIVFLTLNSRKKWKEKVRKRLFI